MTIEEFETKISAIQNAINGVQSELDDIRKKLEKLPDEDDVPEMLDFEDGEKMYFLDRYGLVFDSVYYSEFNHYENEKHSLFKSRGMAELFAEKTQFIADLLYFKELYDRDYVPDWDTDNEKYYISLHSGEYFVIGSTYFLDTFTVYFSSKEIAEKCADWLNRKYKKSDDAS